MARPRAVSALGVAGADPLCCLCCLYTLAGMTPRTVCVTTPLPLTHSLSLGGKTHTMMGPDMDDEDQKGVIPRMVDVIFEVYY